MFIRLLYANNRTKIAKITENVKRKTENFCFSFGAGKRNRRTKQVQSVLAHYALREGGKAHAVGLKRKTFSFFGVLVKEFGVAKNFQRTPFSDQRERPHKGRNARPHKAVADCAPRNRCALISERVQKRLKWKS